MASNIQGKISKYCREIQWLEGSNNISKEFVAAEIERIRKKRSGCDRKLNMDKKEKSVGEFQWKKNPKKKIQF